MSQTVIILFVCGLFFYSRALHVDSSQNPRHSYNYAWLENEKKGFPGKPGRLPDSPPSAENVCNPDMFVGFNVEHSRCGFGSKVNNYMNQLAVAAYGNFSVALVGTAHYEKFLTTWNSFFENPIPVCTSPKKWNIDYQNLLSRTERELVVALSKADEKYVEEGKRAIYKAHYKYKPEAIQHIDSVLKSYGLPEKYIGVQIRHGDKNIFEADAIKTEDYAAVVNDLKIMSVSSAVTRARSAAQHILAMKNNSDIRTVWLATIDKDAETTLRDALGPEYEIKALKQATTDWNGNADMLYYPGSQYVYDVLTDVEALRRSHTFIGTASSNIARWVHFLREPGSKSISLDEHFLERAA
ncbi:unnamed protein product [Prorocentrum cordatum]|uniref:Uncharacterized protein n=1 Tax=Prorocentrum cordatum TaxID=2364126 RepID=A0ABN9UCA4_9DINO|nr:unnamed protein product [Polarella glacialis]|mmetsp:Transcript_50379/g.130863  ORF Transcript_50379/g.130863 Transcript_50379/m.130863 type:complete len:354 (-) Transcript_50379:66-1127(-)